MILLVGQLQNCGRPLKFGGQSPYKPGTTDFLLNKRVVGEVHIIW